MKVHGSSAMPTLKSDHRGAMPAPKNDHRGAMEVLWTPRPTAALGRPWKARAIQRQERARGSAACFFRWRLKKKRKTFCPRASLEQSD